MFLKRTDSLAIVYYFYTQSKYSLLVIFMSVADCVYFRRLVYWIRLKDLF